MTVEELLKDPNLDPKTRNLLENNVTYHKPANYSTKVAIKKCKDCGYGGRLQGRGYCNKCYYKRKQNSEFKKEKCVEMTTEDKKNYQKNYQKEYTLKVRLGLPTKTNVKTERNKLIYNIYTNSNKSFADIGKEFGISRQRVAIIVENYEVSNNV